MENIKKAPCIRFLEKLEAKWWVLAILKTMYKMRECSPQALIDTILTDNKEGWKWSSVFNIREVIPRKITDPVRGLLSKLWAWEFILDNKEISLLNIKKTHALLAQWKNLVFLWRHIDATDVMHHNNLFLEHFPDIWEKTANIARVWLLKTGWWFNNFAVFWWWKMIFTSTQSDLKKWVSIQDSLKIQDKTKMPFWNILFWKEKDSHMILYPEATRSKDWNLQALDYKTVQWLTLAAFSKQKWTAEGAELEYNDNMFLLPSWLFWVDIKDNLLRKSSAKMNIWAPIQLSEIREEVEKLKKENPKHLEEFVKRCDVFLQNRFLNELRDSFIKARDSYKGHQTYLNIKRNGINEHVLAEDVFQNALWLLDGDSMFDENWRFILSEEEILSCIGHLDKNLINYFQYTYWVSSVQKSEDRWLLYWWRDRFTKAKKKERYQNSIAVSYMLWRKMADCLAPELRWVYISPEELLRKQEVHKIYNDHFREQHKKQGHKESQLNDDDMEKNIYSLIDWIRAKIYRRVLKWWIDWYTTQKEHEWYKETLQTIEKAVRLWKSVIILLPHNTFWWFPLAVNNLERNFRWNWLEKLWKSIYERILVVLGPNLVTQIMWKMMNLFWSFRKTIPYTQNAIVEWLEEETWEVRGWFLTCMNEDLGNWEWNIILLNLWWTRDILVRSTEENGLANACFFQDDKSVRQSLALLAQAKRKKAVIVCVWINESWIKDPNQDTSWNNWSKAEVVFDWKVLTPIDDDWKVDYSLYDQLRKEWKILETLAWTVRSWSWEVIWNAIPADNDKFGELKESEDPIWDIEKYLQEKWISTDDINIDLSPASQGRFRDNPIKMLKRIVFDQAKKRF